MVLFRRGIRYFDIHHDRKEEIWLSPMTKAPTPAEMSKGQSDNTNNATKSSITQRLRTDLGRSVGVTGATQLVLWTGLRAQPVTFNCNYLNSRPAITFIYKRRKRPHQQSSIFEGAFSQKREHSLWDNKAYNEHLICNAPKYIVLAYVTRALASRT